MSPSVRITTPIPVFVILVAGFTATTPLGIGRAAAAKRTGELEIRVTDKKSGLPIAANMFLRNSRGRPVRAPGLPFWKNHFAFEKSVKLTLPAGRYTFELERGPEYKLHLGHFTIHADANDSSDVAMERFVDMKQEGWWSGDLHVHRPPADIPLLMRAQDLHMAPVITWWNHQRQWTESNLPDKTQIRFDDNRFYHILAGEDERQGGALLYFNLFRPMPLPARRDHPEYPPMAKFLRMARTDRNAHIDIEKPFWWNVPVWLAMGMADSIGLANNHLLRDGMLSNEAWGKPRDKTLYPDPHGNGYWSQDIYHHILNCGVRIPPSAGSASGVLNNPIGYNRVYVHCGEEITYEKWWEGLRAGRVVVTNGPLLRPRVNGQLPGHIFQGALGETLELTVQMNLSLRDPVKYLEVIKNGKVAHEVRLADYRDRRGKLPPVTFQQSGWMLIRAVTSKQQTFRFASTGPYYVQIGDKPRISRESATFFVNWVDELIENLDLIDGQKRAEIMENYEIAKKFWRKKVSESNAP